MEEDGLRVESHDVVLRHVRIASGSTKRAPIRLDQSEEGGLVSAVKLPGGFVQLRIQSPERNPAHKSCSEKMNVYVA